MKKLEVWAGLPAFSMQRHSKNVHVPPNCNLIPMQVYRPIPHGRTLHAHAKSVSVVVCGMTEQTHLERL